MRCEEGKADAAIDQKVTVPSTSPAGTNSVSCRSAYLYWQVLYPTLYYSHLWAARLILQARWYSSVVFNMCLIKIRM